MESAGLIRSIVTGHVINASSAPNGATRVGIVFGNSLFLVTVAEGAKLSLRAGTLHLTDVGVEMYKLTTPNYSAPYLDEIISEWRHPATCLDPSRSGHCSVPPLLMQLLTTLEKIAKLAASEMRSRITPHHPNKRLR